MEPMQGPRPSPLREARLEFFQRRVEGAPRQADEAGAAVRTRTGSGAVGWGTSRAIACSAVLRSASGSSAPYLRSPRAARRGSPPATRSWWGRPVTGSSRTRRHGPSAARTLPARDREPRPLRPLRDGAHHVLRAALHEPLAHLALGPAFGSVARDRHVGLPGHTVVEGLGQSRGALAGAREGQHAADGAIEAMDDPEEDAACRTPLRSHAFAVHHRGIPAVVEDRGNAGRLDHAEDVVRDVKNFEAGHQAAPDGSSGGSTIPSPSRRRSRRAGAGHRLPPGARARARRRRRPREPAARARRGAARRSAATLRRRRWRGSPGRARPRALTVAMSSARFSSRRQTSPLGPRP